MNLSDLAEGLVASGDYSVDIDGSLLRIRQKVTESEHLIEDFGGSFQLRQAVYFQCLEMSEEEILSVYLLCSNMNERFSGCKNCVDRWGVLVTVSDILLETASTSFVSTMLNQVEFISLAVLDLVGIICKEKRPVTEEEVDLALSAPSLQ